MQDQNNDIGWIDEQEFYELMQEYRHAPISDQTAVVAAFENVKQVIRDKYGDHKLALYRGKQMLEKLGYDNNGARIFEAELAKDKTTLKLIEACDFHFKTDLTKNQVIELANDLLAIADIMVDAK